MSWVLDAQGLGKRYGRRWALDDCDLQIPAGHVVGLVGPNGAGKTTLLHLAVGLLTPTAGTHRGARAPAGADPAQLARVGFVAQDTPTYARLSVADHLHFGAQMNPGWDDATGPTPHRRARTRPRPEGRVAVGRPAGPARPHPGGGQAARAPRPGRAGGQPRPSGPARVPAEPDGVRGRARSQRRPVLAPGRRPRAGLRLPRRARRVAGAGRRRGRRPAGVAPPARRAPARSRPRSRRPGRHRGEPHRPPEHAARALRRAGPRPRLDRRGAQPRGPRAGLHGARRQRTRRARPCRLEVLS